MDRRRVLQLIQAGAAAAVAWPLVRERRAGATTPTTTGPRFFLQIIPQGGMDAVYTTDPKKVGEVEKGIDVPYAPSAIVEAHGTRLGPTFKALAPWLPRLAIVNAFRQNSANHLSGLANVMRCKGSATTGTPSLLEILGARRSGGEATGAINFGTVMTSAFSPKFLGEPSTTTFGSQPGLFDHIDKADPEDLVTLAKALRRDAEPLQGARASAAEKITASNLLEVAELFSKVATAPKFAPVTWKHDYETSYHAGVGLQRALWLFENRLTRCVTMCVCNQDFDTHLWNTTQHAPLTQYLGFLLDKLFTELDLRKVDGQTLAQQTVVVIGSEIGRFPRLNAAKGKDHFPQAPHLFFGKGIVPGTYGATNRSMAAMPVSLATGRPESGGHLLRIDDVGTTLLHLEGANPEVYGYLGEHLTFLTG